jgi:hypothetical protein
MSWASQHATPAGAAGGLCVSTRKTPGVTPAGVLDFHGAGAFATPLDEDDDTPRSTASGDSHGSPERAEVRGSRARLATRRPGSDSSRGLFAWFGAARGDAR